MSVPIPHKMAFDGTITDGEKFDNQWVYVFMGSCRGCGKEIGQKLNFPRWDPQGRECDKPEDFIVEVEMFRALNRNHPCKLRQDLVAPDGRRIPGSYLDGLTNIAEGRA